jgi:AcrR family transcriptional regulator
MALSNAPEGGPTSQRERQRIETRERLFQAAVAEFQRVGVADAQIPAIAEAVGVVRGTFYFHFPSKEHVLLELVERREEELAAGLRALAAEDASLEAVLASLQRAMEPDPGEEASPELVREIVAMQLRTPIDPEEGPRESAAYEALVALFTGLAARGELRTDIAPEPLAATVLTSVFGMAIARSASPDDARNPTPEQLTALLLPGLRPV